MRSPTSFHLFPQLPPELQDLIWKCHRERRGIRHYFVKSGDSCRHYAAIDIETGLFANTFLTKRHIKTYWDDDCRPIKGETDYKIRLTGSRYVSEPGDFAKSVTTSKYAKTWSRKTRPSIRINFDKDVVLLEGAMNYLYSLDPLQKFSSRRINPAFKSNWILNVRFLAIGVADCPFDVPYAIMRFPRLEELYLVVHRDPSCRYGPPRQWKNFTTSLLDSQNFLPLAEFSKLHPNDPTIQCDCELNGAMAELILTHLLICFHTEYDNVKSEIVADPY